MAIRLECAQGWWRLPEGSWVLGRGADAPLQLDDARLSRHHARFEVQNNACSVHDMGSANGLLVNGDHVHGSRALRDGDLVICGPLALHLRLDATPAPERLDGPLVRSRPSTEAELLPSSDRHLRRTEGMEVDDLDPQTPGHLSGDPPAAAPASGRDETGAAHTASVISTSPLESGRTSNRLPVRSSSPRRHESTDRLAPDATVAPATDALQIKGRGRRAQLQLGMYRILAGLLDGLQATVLALLAALPLLGGASVWALRRAGAGLAEGRPILTPPAGPGGEVSVPVAASLAELAQSLLRPGTWLELPQLASQLQTLDRNAFLLLFVGATLATLAVVLVLVFSLVATTMLRGGPFWHRRLGLSLREMRSGFYPGALRSLGRWICAALLWPLAPFACLTGRRSPHDLLAGCRVERRDRRAS